MIALHVAMRIFVGDECGGGGCPVGVVDAYRVRSHGVPRGRGGYEGDVGSVPGEGVPVRVSFLRYYL